MFLPEKGISLSPSLSVFLQQEDLRSILLLLPLPMLPSLEEGARCCFGFLQSLQACLKSLACSLAPHTSFPNLWADPPAIIFVRAQVADLETLYGTSQKPLRLSQWPLSLLPRWTPNTWFL